MEIFLRMCPMIIPFLRQQVCSSRWNFIVPSGSLGLCLHCTCACMIAFDKTSPFNHSHSSHFAPSVHASALHACSRGDEVNIAMWNDEFHTSHKLLRLKP